MQITSRFIFKAEITPSRITSDLYLQLRTQHLQLDACNRHLKFNMKLLTFPEQAPFHLSCKELSSSSAHAPNLSLPQSGSLLGPVSKLYSETDLQLLLHFSAPPPLLSPSSSSSHPCPCPLCSTQQRMTLKKLHQIMLFLCLKFSSGSSFISE